MRNRCVAMPRVKNAICFIGIDGSGKSTQSKMLQETLTEKTCNKIRRVSFFSNERAIAGRKLGSRFMPLVGLFLEALKTPSQSYFVTSLKVVLRMTTILIDAWLAYVLDYPSRNSEVLIYDRYYYDTLVDLAIHHKRCRNFIILSSKLIPVPAILILFSISPEVSLLRKREHDRREAKQIENLYRILRNFLLIQTIDGEQSPQKIGAQVRRIYESCDLLHESL
jgi:thymidylate kinase